MNGYLPWRREILVIVILSALLWVLGAGIGASFWLALVPLLLYTGWNVVQLRRLARWLDSAKSGRLPDVPGIWGYVFYRLDQTRRRREKKRKALVRQVKAYQASASALPEATITLNKRGEIDTVNLAATHLLGIRPEDAGQPLVNFVREPAFHSYLQKKNFDQPLEIAAAGSRQTVISLRMIPYGRGRFMLTARDITEQRRLEQLRQDFVANASHELRTPLTVIQGAVEQLQSDADEDAVESPPLQWMQRQINRMRNIIDDMLALARLEQSPNGSDVVILDMPAIISHICDGARTASNAKGGRNIDLSIDRNLKIHGRPDELQIAITNLVMNAVHHSRAGDAIQVIWTPRLGGAWFEVIDSGPGIPPQHIPRLTERFYRVEEGRSRESGGSGLGLAIVKHVLERYRTLLTIESEPGKGSSFGFFLPAEFLHHVDNTRQTSA